MSKATGVDPPRGSPIDADAFRSLRRLGNCVGLDPDLFHPERGHSAAEAKAVCAGCVIREECLDWALRHERLGIWGGTGERERRGIRRERGIECNAPTLVLVAGCGTSAGYMRHLREKTPSCPACRHAHVQAQLRRRAERKARAS